MSFDKSFEKALSAAGAPKTLHGLPADARYQGTCQACFGSYVTKAARPRKGGKFDLLVVLHGYERPGHGYIQGECPGRAELPFELDKTVTEKFRDRLIAMLASTRDYLARLKGGKVEKLRIEVRDESVPYGMNAPRSRLYKTIEIERGWKNPSPGAYYDTFDRRMESEIANTAMREDSIARDLKEIKERLAAWKYNPAALAEAEEREKSLKASKAATKKATYDEKEGREEAVLASFIENPALVEYLKKKPFEIWKAGTRVSTGQSVYEETMRQIERSRAHDLFGDRSYSRRRVISDLRNLARDAGVKIKAPKW
jgi:hypothetical protein